MFNPANKPHFNLTVAGLENTKLQVLSFEGKESINKPYSFEITLVNKNIRFDITQLLSKPAYLTFTPDGEQGVHGIIQSVRRGTVGPHYAQYSIILTPRFKHLEKRTNQRIFQHKTVPQIITQILNEFGISEGSKHEFRLGPTPYPERDYCVQYDETDAYFIQRLCEEEGIHYHFEHSSEEHLMVFGDTQPIFPSLEPVRYSANTGFVADVPVIKNFDVNLTSKVKRSMWRDYNYTNTKIPEGQAEGAQSAKANGAEEPDIEFYDYPGNFMDNTRGKHLAQIEIERLRADHVLAEGYSDAPSLRTGYFLTINEHPSLDATDPWLLNTIIHQGKQPQVVEALGGEKTAQLRNKFKNDSELEFPDDDFNQGYRNVFTATPQDVVWRPALLHPKAKIYGSQTAKVVGPAGEEIYCDEYGSVKVQFHWDREGQFDENSSCWVRVGSNWAHKGYGTFTIPRVDMEVLITFLEGDPDQPMISGAVNNGTNSQSSAMPANKTRTGFKTNSSPGGGGYNELMFEDKAGNELISMHGQKDMATVIENDLSEAVKNDMSTNVTQDKSTGVGKNFSTTVVNQKTTVVGKGSGSSICMDGENIVLQVGESKIVITADQIFIHGKTHIHQTAAETINLDAPTDITLNCGQALQPPEVPFSDTARAGKK